MGRVALIAAGHWGSGYWGDAAQWATYTKNRIPYHSLNNKIPLEIFPNKSINRGNLRPFGQDVMAHLYTDDKLAPRATPSCILGYTETYGIYPVISKTGKRFLSKNPVPVKQETEEETILPFEDNITPTGSTKDPKTPETIPIPYR